MSTTKRHQWAIGDRVTERARNGGSIATANSPLISRNGTRSRRRTGRIVGIEERPNARGAQCTYVQVLWDGLRTPSRHGSARIELLQETPCR